MSVSSYPAHLARRVPRQARGERRVAELLEAAACVISETGYEAATMSEIASRAGACIGSLYQFFPNKTSIAYALRADYAARIQHLWQPLEEQASYLTLDRLISRMIDTMVAFIEKNPAFLCLLDAPSTRNPSMRAIFRQMVARILSHKVGLPWPRLVRMSSVMLRIFKAMNELYAEAPIEERKAITREFKFLLSCYLAAQPAITNSRKLSNRS